MADVAEPLLLEKFLIFGDVGSLDVSIKAALRLCSKKIKAIIDATPVAGKMRLQDVVALVQNSSTLTFRTLRINPWECDITPDEFTEQLSAVVERFTLLKELYFHCTPAALPDNIGDNLSQLKVLEIFDFSKITTLPASFGQLTALEKLVLGECSKMTLDGLAPLQYLQQLTTLDISGDIVSDPSFPEWIFNNLSTTLKELCVVGQLPSMPMSIGNFTNLTTLTIKGNDEYSGSQFTELPDSIGALTNLEKLILLNEYPFLLPESVSNLISLQEVELAMNESSIEPLQHLTGLTKLTLSRFFEEESQEFPASLGNLTSLKSLVLHGSGAEFLPDSIGNLGNLEMLRLSSLGIQKLPNSIGDLAFLTALEVMDTCFKRFPESIGELTALKSITLENVPELRTLPKSIGYLKNLESLSLTSCADFAFLPSTIGDLKSLTRLVLVDSGELTTLPSTIGNLDALKVLNVTECFQFSKIPDSIANLIRNKDVKDWSVEELTFCCSRRLTFSRSVAATLHQMKNNGVEVYAEVGSDFFRFPEYNVGLD